MASFEIDVNGTEYRGETAPATDQWEALHCALNSKLILGLKEEVTDQAMVVMVMGTPFDQLKRLEKLLLKNVVRVEDESVAAPLLFKDKPEEYALLLGKVARENLSGFYRLSGNKDSAKPMGSNQPAQNSE